MRSNSVTYAMKGQKCRIWPFVAVFLFCLCPISVSAEFLPLEKVPALERTARSIHCQSVDPDFSPSYTLSAADSLPWQPAPHDNINQGFSDQECWLQSALRNTSEQTLKIFIVTGYALLEQVDLTIVDRHTGKIIAQQRAGTGIPYADWPVKSQTPTFELMIPPQTEWRLIWRIRSAYSLQFDSTFLLEADFYSEQEKMVAMHCLFFGAMLVMVVYNLFVYAAVREKVYLLYVFWASTMTLFQVFYWGFGQRFLWPESAEFSRVAMILLLPFVLLFGPWFSRTFLRLDALSSVDDQVMKLTSYSGVVLFFSLALIDYYYVVPVATVLIQLMIVFITVISVRRLRAGDRSALYFAVAWLCLIIGTTFMALNKLGVIPVSALTVNLVELGTCLEVVLLSLALAERIKMLKAEGKQAQEERERAEFEANKARELSQTKSEFLAAMSHEIRTPMNGVLAMADLLRYSKLAPEPASYVDTIYQSTTSLLTVINDILDYSRIESGKMEIDPVAVNVEALVDECCQLFAVQSRKKGLPLVVSIAPDVPVQLMLDPVRVKQIINNLLGNAFKFTEQGYVMLSVTMRRSGECVEAPCLLIDVSDTGIGMTETEQGRLFKEFSQADRSIVRRFGGSGLGLTICKKLLDLMQGDIQIFSTAGRGSRFRVVLPSARATDQSPQVELLLNKTVLIVESEDIARSSYAVLCQRWGMQVQTAACLPPADEVTSFAVLIMSGACASGCDRLAKPANAPVVIQLGGFQSESLNSQAFDIRFLYTPVSVTKLRVALEEVFRVTEVDTRNSLTNTVEHGWSALRVLVAEDNPVNQLVIKRLLAKLNVEPIIVADGQAALNQVAAGPVDMIFMDCDMPVLDGYQATSAIRLQDSNTRPWIIGLSANAAQEDVERAMASGMDDYVAKPVTLEQIRRAITEGMRQASAVSAGGDSMTG